MVASMVSHFAAYLCETEPRYQHDRTEAERQIYREVCSSPTPVRVRFARMLQAEIKGSEASWVDQWWNFSHQDLTGGIHTC